MNQNMPVSERVRMCVREWSEEHPETEEKQLVNALQASLDDRQAEIFTRLLQEIRNNAAELEKRIYLTGFCDAMHAL